MASLDATMSEYFMRFIVPLTCFLVGLKILGFLYSKFFDVMCYMICERISKQHHAIIKERKEKLFSELSSIRKDSNQRFFALEIGCGPGANFGMYPANTSLVLVEPNGRFEKDAVKNTAKHPSLEIAEFLAMGAEDLKGHVKDASQDAVVSTLTLCSVNDVDAVISEIYRVLKPGGRYYFIEHTRAHTKNTRTHIVQRILAPVFWVLAHCHLTNTSYVTLDRKGFNKVHYTKLQIEKLPIMFRPHVFGYAEKYITP